MSTLTEFKSRIKNCLSIDDYVHVLKWGFYEVNKNRNTADDDFRNPIVAMLIEVFFLCPEAAMICQKELNIDKPFIFSNFSGSSTTDHKTAKNAI